MEKIEVVRRRRSKVVEGDDKSSVDIDEDDK